MTGTSTPPNERGTIVVGGRQITVAPAGPCAYGGRVIITNPYDPYNTRLTSKYSASPNLDILLGRYEADQVTLRHILIEGLGYTANQCGSFGTYTGFQISIIKDIKCMVYINRKHCAGTLTGGDYVLVTPALHRFILAMGGLEMLSGDCIKWIAGLTYKRGKHGTTAKHNARVAGFITAWRRCYVCAIMRWAIRLDPQEFHLSPQLCGELPVIVQMLISASTMATTPSDHKRVRRTARTARGSCWTSY